MAEIVELVAKKTVARAVEVRKKNARASSGYRSVRLARKGSSEVTLPEDTAAALKEPMSLRELWSVSSVQTCLCQQKFPKMASRKVRGMGRVKASR